MSGGSEGGLVFGAAGEDRGGIMAGCESLPCGDRTCAMVGCGGIVAEQTDGLTSAAITQNRLGEARCRWAMSRVDSQRVGASPCGSGGWRRCLQLRGSARCACRGVGETAGW